MSRITRFLCYYFLLKYSSVLYFTLFPSLDDAAAAAAAAGGGDDDDDDDIVHC